MTSETPTTSEALDAAAIGRAIAAAGCVVLPRIEVLASTPSTNEALLARARAGQSVHAVALLAEQQSAGRGRRGRAWVSPPGGNLYLSLGWRTTAATLDGLSLVAGLAVARAIEDVAGVSVQLKWPNDIQSGGRKLGGILIELHFDADGTASVVTGIGLNLALPAEAAAGIGQPWTDLASLCARMPARNTLVAAVLAQLLARILQFEREGFAPFHAEWNARDALRGHAVTVSGTGEPLRGAATGVDAQGALQVLCDGVLRTVSAGDVTLRTEA